MRVALLTAAGLIATAAISAPGAAQSGAAAGFTGATAAQSGQFTSFRGDRGRHDRRRHRGFEGAFYYGDREYQGDTAWRAEGFNDWWHERPNRSYPVWMTRNQNCERQWWSGNVLRC